MPSCSAANCVNRHFPGTNISFFCFPKDSLQRKAWLRVVRKKNYQPKDSHVLCSLHFNEGDILFSKNRKRKYLRPGAIPRRRINLKPTKQRTTKNSNKLDSSDNTKPIIQNNINKTKIELGSIVRLDHPYTASTDKVFSKTRSTQTEESLPKVREGATQTTESYVDNVIASEIASAVKRVFNADQIQSMCIRGKVPSWSPSTIKRARKIRLSCGTTGYEMLLKQGFPLPSLRTIRRHLENENLKSEVLKDGESSKI